MLVGVTGASGLIGRKLVDALVGRGWYVRALTRSAQHSRQNLKIFRADLTNDRDNKTLTGFLEGLDVLFHCAGETRQRKKMWTTNVVGTSNLMNLARGRAGRIIYLGSAGVYSTPPLGSQDGKSKVVDEESAFRPLGSYEHSKMHAENLLMGSSIPTTIIQPTIVLSKDSEVLLIEKLIRLVQMKKFFYLDKHCYLNAVDVEDLVDALLITATNSHTINQRYILSEAVPLSRIVDMILQLSGNKYSPPVVPRPLVRALGLLLNRLPFAEKTNERFRFLTCDYKFTSRKFVDSLNFRFNSSIGVNLENYVRSR